MLNDQRIENSQLSRFALSFLHVFNVVMRVHFVVIGKIKKVAMAMAVVTVTKDEHRHRQVMLAQMQVEPYGCSRFECRAKNGNARRTDIGNADDLAIQTDE